MMPHVTDLNLTPKDFQGLTSADAVAGFLTALGYDTSSRKSLTPESIGLSGDFAAPLRAIEVLSEDAEGFLRVVFVQLRSLTAKSRNDLARVLGRTNVDHLLILTSDFETLEFVLLDKRRRESRGPVDVQRIQVVPLSLAVARKSVGTRELRAIRRFTWTSRDGLEQFDKLRGVFEAAAFSEDYFCNRALFADHYLLTRLREDPAWRDNPTEAFQQVKRLLADPRTRWLNKGEAVVREQLFEPIFKLLGFDVQVNKAPGESHTRPDYLLSGAGGKTAAYVYAWDRWLDGPDFNLDQQTPEENPGACVVTALNEGVADWIIMTNGRQWRLYSRHAHSRATNFYEVDLAEALIASGDTDPNEAFRYWWLFFRAAAFAPLPTAGNEPARCWLDAIAEGSREYAKQLGERLKQRIFETIFPHLAKGFLEDRKRRLGVKTPPTDEDLHDVYEATLTLLYRLLFLLYAESRDLLPIREAPYRAASLTKIKEEIALRAGIAESESAARIEKAFSADQTSLYDRLQRLCAALDCGDASLNVPIYNGGLFITSVGQTCSLPAEAGSFDYGHESREQRFARFLLEHKVPDRYLALAIDRLARDPDDKTLALVFIDYKSLEVRHLGSIYEGLLEFKLRVAEEDLTTKSEKGKEKFTPLTAAKPKGHSFSQPRPSAWVRGSARQSFVCVVPRRPNGPTVLATRRQSANHWPVGPNDVDVGRTWGHPPSGPNIGAEHRDTQLRGRTWGQRASRRLDDRAGVVTDFSGRRVTAQDERSDLGWSAAREIAEGRGTGAGGGSSAEATDVAGAPESWRYAARAVRPSSRARPAMRCGRRATLPASWARCAG